MSAKYMVPVTITTGKGKWDPKRRKFAKKPNADKGLPSVRSWLCRAMPTSSTPNKQSVTETVKSADCNPSSHPTDKAISADCKARGAEIWNMWMQNSAGCRAGEKRRPSFVDAIDQAKARKLSESLLEHCQRGMLAVTLNPSDDAKRVIESPDPTVVCNHTSPGTQESHITTANDRQVQSSQCPKGTLFIGSKSGDKLFSSNQVVSQNPIDHDQKVPRSPVTVFPMMSIEVGNNSAPTGPVCGILHGLISKPSVNTEGLEPKIDSNVIGGLERCSANQESAEPL